MLFALDYNDNRVRIENTHSNQEYYCPGCGAPLVVKRGDIRRHHFAHLPKHICADTWERDGVYDVSEWHENWQSKFPVDNQEVSLVLGNTKHRADVLIDRTVVEFQHSVIRPQLFDDRNNFYLNIGYKVIWLFDLSEQYNRGELYYKECENGLSFTWKKAKKTFNAFDVQCGCIEVFFQIKNQENDSIVRVMQASEHGFEEFETTQLMGKEDFLSYVGCNKGTCLKPDRDDLTTNKKYIEFKEKYNINLNRQQERALQAIEGAVLLLAVPGSGKTTVLVDRMGYMILVKNILPESILALTYNVEARKELQKRYDAKFGKVVEKRVNIRTLHSLSKNIYEQSCKEKKTLARRILSGTSQICLVRQICKEIRDVPYVSHSEVQEVMTAISYVKNMMDEDRLAEYNYGIEAFSSIYKEYQRQLAQRNEMDFDDQLVFALSVLRNNDELLEQYRNIYKYICVDEAQDTSKIQHEILQLLARGNSIFMVGDEDQSIYGFRGAYPKALLNFRYNYRNPYILKMEKNYRSTKKIVDAAQRFISRNKGRYEKNMVSSREEGNLICKVVAKSRHEQYLDLLEVAKTCGSDTAILYRDNDSAVVLADLLFRNNIPFNLKKPERSFYENLVVRDIMSYLRLAVDETDWQSFENILWKGIIYITAKNKYHVCRICREQKCSIFEALEKQRPYILKYIDDVNRLRITMDKIKTETSAQAIKTIMDAGYESYCREKSLDLGKIEILLMLAEQEPNIENFLKRLKELDNSIKDGVIADKEDAVLLSTIHTSKGQEYDSVFMIDIYDGRFPSVRDSRFNRSKDSANIEQEERRLFYVGITRAKNNLFLYELRDRKSTFIAELFDGVDKGFRVCSIEEKEEVDVLPKEPMAQESDRCCEVCEDEKKVCEGYLNKITIEPVTHKKPSSEEILKQNPKIKLLLDYISGLKTLGGTFTYVSKKDRSSTCKYETINIEDVGFNPDRMRIEINSHSDNRHIIFLKLDKRKVYTEYTYDGYLIFSFYESEECDVILKFRQMLECDGERYETNYICTLDHLCMYQGADSSICTNTSKDVRCSFRKSMMGFKRI